jgi:hypothetical protein
MRLALVIAVALSVPLFPAAPAGAANYPLTCKLGQLNDVYFNQIGIVITIQPSAGPASSGLQPGQCAFEDRGIRASEPKALCLPGAAVTAMDFQGGKMNAFGSSFSGPGAAVIHTAIFGPTSIANFTVHNRSDNQCFVVDTVGV